MNNTYVSRMWNYKGAVGLICLALIMPHGPASAGSGGQNIWGDLLNGLVNAAIIANAQNSWLRVDPNVRDCLARQYNISASDLVNQGITAEDQRVMPYVQQCRQAVAQAREQELEQQRAQQAQEQAAAEARQAQEAAAEKARQDALAAEAAAKAQKVAQHRELETKYGKEMADAISAGEVRTGMTKDEVLAARGNPDKKEVIPPSDELWQYGSERVAISSGKVTYVGH